MAIKDDKYTLSTTAELIAAGGEGSNYKTVMIRSASDTVYLGGATVTAADGFPLNVDETFSLELGPQDDLYAIAGSGTPTINVLVTRSNARVSTGD
jgi:hypothetical protein